MKTRLLLLTLLFIASASMSWSQTAPASPTITGVATDSQLAVAYTASSDGGSAIIGYKYSTDGGTTFSTATTLTNPIVITTLSTDGTTKIVSGTSYNIQIKAVNAIGDGVASATSAATYIFLGGGAGTTANPYLITTVNDLVAARSAAVTNPATPFQSANYKLMANLNMSTVGNFNSFGSYAIPFKGSFNGNGHKVLGVISGTSSARLSNATVGFFGFVDGATISNLSVDVSYYITSTPTVASTGSSCAGLVAYTSGTGNIVINNCHVTGIIDALTAGSAATSFARAGGIICNPSSSTNATITIVNSTVDATIIASNQNTAGGSSFCGGIVGEVRSAGVFSVSIINCSAAGSTSALSTLGNSSAGGIVSYSYAPNATINIFNCLATNTVSTSGVSASGYNGTPAAGIGQVPTANCQIKYCMALNPSISGVNTVSSTGTQALDRVYSGSVVPTTGNVDFNYAKADMTVQGTVNGVGPTAVTLAGKTTTGKDGADLGTDPSTEATSKLNSYVSSNPTFNGLLLTNWINGGLNYISENRQIMLKPLNYQIINGLLNFNGIEGTKQLSIYSISGAVCKQLMVTDSYKTSILKGIYILKVDGFAPTKLVVY